MFSEKLKSAIEQVSGIVVRDLELESGDDVAYCVAETVLDSDRLGFFGFKEAQEELNKLLETKSFTEVCEAASEIVYY